MSKKFNLNDRVQLVSSGKRWRPSGTIVEIQPEVTLNGRVVVEETYKVKWDDDRVISAWLSADDLIEE